MSFAAFHVTTVSYIHKMFNTWKLASKPGVNVIKI